MSSHACAYCKKTFNDLKSLDAHRMGGYGKKRACHINHNKFGVLQDGSYQYFYSKAERDASGLIPAPVGVRSNMPRGLKA